MNQKGSYFQKHRLKEDPGAQPLPKIIHPPLSPGQKATFEAGAVILLDKALHWTSFDIVRKIRNRIKIKKVGHAGTLDPLATGLLIVCTGKFTKKINEYMAARKEYTGTIVLGAVTPTYDRESEPEQQKDCAGISAGDIDRVTKQFIGDIQQFPPIYSAIKKAGTPLYELARRGIDVELEPRNISIHEFEITRVQLPEVDFRIVCSTGTYIRSVAHDVGKALGCGGYLGALRRTKIGEFSVDEALTMDAFLASLDLPGQDSEMAP